MDTTDQLIVNVWATGLAPRQQPTEAPATRGTTRKRPWPAGGDACRWPPVCGRSRNSMSADTCRTSPSRTLSMNSLRSAGAKVSNDTRLLLSRTPTASGVSQTSTQFPPNPLLRLDLRQTARDASNAGWLLTGLPARATTTMILVKSAGPAAGVRRCSRHSDGGQPRKIPHGIAGH